MQRHITALLLVVGLLVFGVVPAARAASLPKELAPLSFLLGDWEGGGGGTPGSSNGGTSFVPGLQDRVIIRTNFAVTAATGKTPASRHDDLMIVHVDGHGVVRADYYDSEGHVIRYTVVATGSGQVVFTSGAEPATPRYRLTYQAASSGIVTGTFSIAPPGTPDAFAPYLTWEMRRKAPSR